MEHESNAIKLTGKIRVVDRCACGGLFLLISARMFSDESFAEYRCEDCQKRVVLRSGK